MRFSKLISVALFGLAVSVVAAQDAPRPVRPRAAAADNAAPGPLERGKVLLEGLTKALDLTAEQQTAIKQIIETHQQSLANWRNALGEDMKTLREQIEKARTDKDEAALKTLREKMDQAAKGRLELDKKMRDQIRAVLTDDQKAKFETAFLRLTGGTASAPASRPVVRRPAAVLEGLSLTDEQKAQVEKLLGEARAKPEGDERVQAVRAAMQKIQKDVLTDAQREQLLKNRENAPQGRPLRGAADAPAK